MAFGSCEGFSIGGGDSRQQRGKFPHRWCAGRRMWPGRVDPATSVSLLEASVLTRYPRGLQTETPHHRPDSSWHRSQPSTPTKPPAISTAELCPP